MSTLDICMVTWQRPEITYVTIKAIKENTTYPHRLIVIDNGSDEDMKQMLRNLYESGDIDRLHFNNQNLGLEPARNKCLEEVQSELFVTTDSDCLPMKPDEGGDWLSKMVKLMNDNPEYAAISARTQVMIGTGNIFEEYEDEEIVDFPHPGGSLRIMRTALVKAVGGWRDEEGGRGTEERYIGGKLRELGHKTAFAVRVRCLHLFGRRGELGTDRWGYPVGWTPEQTGHSDIWHPVLQAGDDPEAVKEYISEELAEAYFAAGSD